MSGAINRPPFFVSQPAGVWLARWVGGGLRRAERPYPHRGRGRRWRQPGRGGCRRRDGYPVLNWVIKQWIVKPTLRPGINKVTGADKGLDLPQLLRP